MSLLTPAPVTQDVEGTSKARLFLLCWLQEPTQKPPSTPIPGNEDPEDSLHFLVEMSPQQLENSNVGRNYFTSDCVFNKGQ